MANIDIQSISGIHESANDIRKQCEQFKETAQQLKTATDTLTQSADGWQSEASEIFNANITAAKTWLDEIATVVEEFAAALDVAADSYVETDSQAAQGFK